MKNKFYILIALYSSVGLTASEDIPQYVIEDVIEYLRKNNDWSCHEYIIGPENYSLSEPEEGRLHLRVTHRDDLDVYSDMSQQKSVGIVYNLKDKKVMYSLGYQ